MLRLFTEMEPRGHQTVSLSGAAGMERCHRPERVTAWQPGLPTHPCSGPGGKLSPARLLRHCLTKVPNASSREPVPARLQCEVQTPPSPPKRVFGGCTGGGHTPQGLDHSRVIPPDPVP